MRERTRRKRRRRGAQGRAGGTSQENDVDPSRYLSSAGRSTTEIAASPGFASLYIDIRVSPASCISVYNEGQLR